MRFTGLIDYAARRGLTFERIALREITLKSTSKSGCVYRTSFVLIDGGWWVDADVLMMHAD